MFRKFMAFVMAVVVLLAASAYVADKYLIPKEYPVFIESFGHGVMTVDSDETVGEDGKYHISCKSGSYLTVNINPERTDKTYYNLSELIVNGENVTDQVNMLQYRVKVSKKTDILAHFEKGKRVETSSDKKTLTYKNKPVIEQSADNKYLGSAAAYDFRDPSVIFDEKSGYYYCFGSSNVVARSKNLVDWEDRTTYFASPDSAGNEAVMDFGQFSSVSKWAKAHGYSKDKSASSSTNNREPQTPDIIKIGSVYYLYFALSKSENANESAIFCVRTTDLAYAIENHDWQDVGLVISTCGYNKGENSQSKNKSSYDESYAVSPSVFFDKDGNLLMAYGSYYGTDSIKGGIYLLELNAKTGLLKEESKLNSRGALVSTLHAEERYNTGELIAKPGKIPALSKKQGSLVTACDIVYNSETDYYYLFVTYGDEESNYNIRVARSKTPKGPYTDFNQNSMSSFGTSARNHQYKKGLKLIGGYNFVMSSGGGVSYVDVGRASVGSPSIIKTQDNKWIMASQSRVYYKFEDDIVTGDALAKENDLKVDTAPSLEIRQIFFEEDGWPLALAEVYTGESANKNIKPENMYGHWDVVVLDREADKNNYKAVERSVSVPVSIMNGYVITKNDIESEADLSKHKLEKNGKNAYSIVIDGVRYKVYPTICWDWELSEAVYAFTGIGEDGSTVFGKKNFSTYMGIYTDVFYYLLDMTNGKTRDEYEEKMEKISSNPTQSKIDEMTKELISKLA